MIRMKIGSKLLLSYILIIVLCFAVGFTVFGYLSRQYMISQAREDLKAQGEALAKSIGDGWVQNEEQNGPLASESPDSAADRLIVESMPGVEIYNAQRRQMQLAGSLVDTRMVLIDARGQLAYSNLEPAEMELFKSRGADNLEASGFIIEKFDVSGPGGESGAVLILAASLEDMRRINRMSFRAQSLSVLAALLLAVLLGVFFERTLARPLSRLMKAMQSFAVNKPLPALDINTGDEIGELARCFDDMAHKLQRYDERQKALLQNTSHELKTPLMSIQGYAEAIRDGVVDGPEVEASLNIIIEESQRLKATVSDLLYLSRVENVEEDYRFEKASLAGIIDHALRTVRPLAADGDIEISADCDPGLQVLVDPDKIERTLVNIIGNAVRYARRQISIECSSAGDEVLITVRDDGPGFQNGEEARVFERFYKGTAGGSGLGLAIARAIVTGHKGTMQAFNAGDGGGAVFQIILPICRTDGDDRT